MDITPAIAAQQMQAVTSMAMLVIPIVLVVLMRAAMNDQSMIVTVGAGMGFVLFALAVAWLAPLGDDIWQQALKPNPY